jgi:uncharacterized membrane protein YcjF (UPF0283 family)
MTVHSLSAYTSEPALAAARRRIEALFEKHRVTPGAPYDELHFMDFLLAERQGRRAVADGFRASRRFNAFIEDVQYEFAICFSAHDRHAHHSLQNFTERVIDLGRSRRRSLWPWKNQLTTGVEWAVAVLANLVLLIAAVWVKNHAWALAAVGLVAVLVNAWFVRFAWRATTYFKRLGLRIAAAERHAIRQTAHSGGKRASSSVAIGIELSLNRAHAANGQSLRHQSTR